MRNHERWSDQNEFDFNNLDYSSTSAYDLTDEEIGLIIEHGRLEYYEEFFKIEE